MKGLATSGDRLDLGGEHSPGAPREGKHQMRSYVCELMRYGRLSRHAAQPIESSDEAEYERNTALSPEVAVSRR